MIATAGLLSRFLEGAEKRFLIPVYQRTYDWEAMKECSELWDDLLIVGDKPHFFGSIVRIKDENEEGDAYIIIDGQQRITTVSLLLMAIFRKSKKISEEIEKHPDAEPVDLPDIAEIQELYLGKYSNKAKLKLKPIKSDSEAFRAVYEDAPGFKESNIRKNYDFFMSQLTAQNIKQIYEAIKQLEIVDIRLNPSDDNPQMVFESLNAKGKPLSASDKIRNLMLLGLNAETQEEYYDKYWKVIEKNSFFETDKFIRHFIGYVDNKLPKKDDIYRAFKEHKQNQDARGHNSKDLLEQLLNFSYLYRQIFEQNFDDENINEHLENLIKKLKTEVAVPLLLDAFDKLEKNEISTDDVVVMLKIMESYVVRRYVCNIGTAGTDKIFLITNTIKKQMRDTGNSYLDVFKHFMTNITNNALRFPNDAEFGDALPENDIYTSHISHCKYLLGELENFASKEKIDLSELSIEHVMPQTLSREWQLYLGDNWNKIHSVNLHTLGNLTLTGYNSDYSNKSFTTKKQMEDGFKASPLRLNRYIADCQEWNAGTIKERGKKLRDEALQIWKMYMPTGKYEDDDKPNSINLNYPNSLSGTKPEWFEFMGEKSESRSWRDLYITIVNILYGKYKGRMQVAFDNGNNREFRDIISNRAESQGENGQVFWEQIIPGNLVYFRLNKSSDGIREALIRWFNFLDLDPDDVNIGIR